MSILTSRSECSQPNENNGQRKQVNFFDYCFSFCCWLRRSWYFSWVEWMKYTWLNSERVSVRCREATAEWENKLVCRASPVEEPLTRRQKSMIRIPVLRQFSKARGGWTRSNFSLFFLLFLTSQYTHAWIAHILIVSSCGCPLAHSSKIYVMLFIAKISRICVFSRLATKFND